MYITKSLFVEYTSSPKLARWHINDKDTYNRIQDALYWAMDGITIGQTVEDMVLSCYLDKKITEIDTDNMRSNRHQTYHDRTMKALEENPEILYQPSFLVNDMFVKCDILIRNDEWSYDLIEVKAKNSIRKKTKAEPLLDELIADVSVQRRVLQIALKEKFSGKCYLAYVNKEYTKNGHINPKEIIIQEEVSSELLEDANIEAIIKNMRETLPLHEDEFNKLFPYDGSDYMTYFGTSAPKNSIRSISWCSAKKKLEFYEQNKLMLDDLNEYDIEFLKNADWEISKSSHFLQLWKEWPQTIDVTGIWQMLEKFTFPLYFYDYETISRPVPIFDWTTPWQQVVVQYSIHKMDKDWSISHYESILQAGSIASRYWNGKVENNDERTVKETGSEASLYWTNQNNSTNKKLLEKMLEDMDWVSQGTRIVWNQGFENSRNDEWGKQFPEYADALHKINNATFDLMEIFRQQLFFHRNFEGSASIKKVLPVLTDISYDDLEVWNGGVASDLLRKLMVGEIDDRAVDDICKNLLEYCKQDTWAMVKIYQKVCNQL